MIQSDVVLLLVYFCAASLVVLAVTAILEHFTE